VLLKEGGYMNINLNANESGWESIEIDSKIFELENIYRALYCLLEKAYFMIRTTENGNFMVFIKKKSMDTKFVKEELNNELIKFKELERREKASKELEKAILTDIIFPKTINMASDDIKDIDFEKLEKELESELNNGECALPMEKHKDKCT
jgi:hypothetical protein